MLLLVLGLVVGATVSVLAQTQQHTELYYTGDGENTSSPSVRVGLMNSPDSAMSTSSPRVGPLGFTMDHHKTFVDNTYPEDGELLVSRALDTVTRPSEVSAGQRWYDESNLNGYKYNFKLLPTTSYIRLLQQEIVKYEQRVSSDQKQQANAETELKKYANPQFVAGLIAKDPLITSFWSEVQRRIAQREPQLPAFRYMTDTALAQLNNKSLEDDQYNQQRVDQDFARRQFEFARHKNINDYITQHYLAYPLPAMQAPQKLVFETKAQLHDRQARISKLTRDFADLSLN